jgi:transposase
MIQVTSRTRVLVHIESVDFRAGIDGLCRVCREEIGADPFGGAVFVFRGRRGTAVKLLFYDGQGFWLCQKRLSEGRFRYWPRGPSEDGKTLELLSHQLQVLLMAGDPAAAQGADMWRPL